MSHWYDTDGNPQHYLGKDGAATTLRHARIRGKEGNPIFPSVTTVGQVVAKFALTNWLQEQAVFSALELMGISGNEQPKDINNFAKVAIVHAREKTMAKADAGTDIHDVLEKFQQDMDCKPENEAMCAAVRMCIEENTELDFFEDFQAETRFCDTEHGYGGMVDLHGNTWIIDYKTKDEVTEKTRGWPEQAEQLAAYANGLEYPNARLANVFISRTDPTQVIWFEHADPEYAWSCFLDTLHIWQKQKKFGPWYQRWLKEVGRDTRSLGLTTRN